MRPRRMRWGVSYLCAVALVAVLFVAYVSTGRDVQVGKAIRAAVGGAGRAQAPAPDRTAGRVEGAVDLVRRASELYETDPAAVAPLLAPVVQADYEAQMWSGFAATKLGRADDAVGFFRMAVRSGPENWQAWMNLIAYAQRLSSDERVEAAEALMRLVPERPEGMAAISEAEAVALAESVATIGDASRHGVLTVLLGHASFDVRRAATDWLARINDPRLYPAVLEEYRDTLGRPNVPWDYRWALSQAVSRMGVAALPFFDEWIDEGRLNGAQTSNLAWHLGHLTTKFGLVAEQQDPQLVAICRKLMRSADWGTKLRAAGSLGRAGLDDGFEIAMAGLELPPGIERMTAARALAFIPRPEGKQPAAEVALAGLDDSPDEGARQEAIHALANLAEQLPETLQSRIGDRLEPMLGHEQAPVRQITVRALGLTGQPRFVETIGRVLVEDEHADVRTQAAQALWRMEDPRSEAVLLTGAADVDVGVRGWCLRALFTIPATVAVRDALTERLPVEPDQENQDRLRALIDRPL